MRLLVLFGALGLAIGVTAVADAVPEPPRTSACGPVTVQVVEKYGKPCIIVKLLGEGTTHTTCVRPPL